MTLRKLTTTERRIVGNMRDHGLPITLGMMHSETTGKRLLADGIIVYAGHNDHGVPQYVLAPEWKTP